MAKHSIYARLSEEVYREKGGVVPDGWEILGYSYPNDNTSFGICVYRNESLKEIVIALRGTDNLTDLYNDAYLAMHTPPPYLDSALNFQNKISKNNKNITNKNLSLPVNNVLKSIQSDLIYSADYKNLMGYLNDNILFQKELITAPTLFVSMVIGDLKKHFLNSPSDEKTFYLKLVEYMAKYYALGISGFIPDVSLQNGFNVNLKNSRDALKDFENEYAGYKIIFTGHSLGGALAQLCAIILDKTCITFDNPGVGEIVTNLKISTKNLEDKITAYLSSPHVVNTHGSHLGKIYRIYFPHVDKNSGFWAQLRYFNKSLSNTSKKLLVGSVALTPVFFVAIGVLIIDILNMLAYDAKTLLRLHSITNIREAMEEKVKLWKIESWPKADSFFYAYVKSFIPFANDYNLYQFFVKNENDLIESKIKSMNGYKVIECDQLEMNHLSAKDEQIINNNVFEFPLLKSKL